MKWQQQNNKEINASLIFLAPIYNAEIMVLALISIVPKEEGFLKNNYLTKRCTRKGKSKNMVKSFMVTVFVLETNMIN